MRTTKIERQKNARKFYNMFMNSKCNKAAFVVERKSSTNPHVSKCQFVAVCSALAFGESPVIIAESNFGIDGCFIELLGAIKSGPQKTYWEDGFNEWLKDNYHFEITYKDGLVFVLEK